MNPEKRQVFLQYKGQNRFLASMSNADFLTYPFRSQRILTPEQNE